MNDWDGRASALTKGEGVVKIDYYTITHGALFPHKIAKEVSLNPHVL